MDKIIATVAALFLTGCAATRQCDPVTVKVPVAASCVKSVPDRPTWAIDSPPESPTDFEKTQALTIDWAQQRQYINGLEAVIKGGR